MLTKFRRTMFLFKPEGDNGGGNPGNPPPTGGGQADPTVTMTQKQLDALFAERGNQGRSALLRELGFEKPEDLKAILAKVKEAEDAAKTEQQRLAEKAQQAEAKAQQLEREKNDALAKANETLLRSTVMLKAANFNDPTDAWQFVDRSKIAINDAGEVEGVDKALEELAKAKPYLLKDPAKKTAGTPQSATNRGGNKTTKTEGVPVIRQSY